MSQSLLEFQCDVLKLELETVNQSIRQMDDITKSVKEWTIGLWTAAVGGALVTPALTTYLWLTATIPLLFWLVDTWHRRIQRKFVWRSIAVSRFLNGPELRQSFDAGAIAFKLWDPQARLGRDEAYKRFIAWQRIMFFPSLSLLYGGLAALSVIVWLSLR